MTASKTTTQPQQRVIPARPVEQLTAEEKVARGHEAKRLMEHPLIRNAFANLRLDYFEAFCRCPVEKVHDRDRLFHAASVINDVEQQLRMAMQEGQVAQGQIDKMAQRK
jgi:hypothetical protein